MITAKQAADASARTKRKQEHERRKQQRTKQRFLKQADAKALREEVPFVLKEIMKQIAIGPTNRRVVWSLDSTRTTTDVVAAAVIAKLQKKGFKVERNHRSGESNYGDFNAPCIVSWSKLDLIVSW